MTTNNLRKMLMLHGDVIKTLHPTDSQRRVFMICKARGKATSDYIAHCLGISIQNATAQLKGLYDKGYLKRRNVGNVTGGLEYIYTPIEWE